jgi:hypothetical protein
LPQGGNAQIWRVTFFTRIIEEKGIPRAWWLVKVIAKP